ncbi:MAG: class I SAM-dependent methyltransferase, partial [Deltaproteobacteria bacterium]|nr:class I SAM-dependent methyltransferase [Deltaproteobacteria bacterium]
DEIKDKFDLAVCSHFLWQIEDIEGLLKRMENVSKKYCAVIQPCGRDEIVKEIFELLCSQKYTGQFDPDADYFAYVILREWGRLVSIGHFEYTFERDLEEEIRCVAGFTGKFIEIDQDVMKKIEGYLLNISKNGLYVEKNQAVVMWWQPEK